MARRCETKLHRRGALDYAGTSRRLWHGTHQDKQQSSGGPRAGQAPGTTVTTASGAWKQGWGEGDASGARATGDKRTRTRRHVNERYERCRWTGTHSYKGRATLWGTDLRQRRAEPQRGNGAQILWGSSLPGTPRDSLPRKEGKEGRAHHGSGQRDSAPGSLRRHGPAPHPRQIAWQPRQPTAYMGVDQNIVMSQGPAPPTPPCSMRIPHAVASYVCCGHIWETSFKRGACCTGGLPQRGRRCYKPNALTLLHTLDF